MANNQQNSFDKHHFNLKNEQQATKQTVVANSKITPTAIITFDEFYQQDDESGSSAGGQYQEQFTYYKPQQYTGKGKIRSLTSQNRAKVDTTLNLVVEQTEEDQLQNSRNYEQSPNILSGQMSIQKPPLAEKERVNSGPKKKATLKDLNEMRSMRDQMRKSLRFQSQYSQYSNGSQLQNIKQIQKQIQELEQESVSGAENESRNVEPLSRNLQLPSRSQNTSNSKNQSPKHVHSASKPTGRNRNRIASLHMVTGHQGSAGEDIVSIISNSVGKVNEMISHHDGLSGTKRRKSSGSPFGQQFNVKLIDIKRQKTSPLQKQLFSSIGPTPAEQEIFRNEIEEEQTSFVISMNRPHSTEGDIEILNQKIQQNNMKKKQKKFETIEIINKEPTVAVYTKTDSGQKIVEINKIEDIKQPPPPLKANLVTQITLSPQKKTSGLISPKKVIKDTKNKVSPKVVKTVTLSPKIKRKVGNMSPDDLKMIKKYEGMDAVPVAVEEVNDEEMMPIVRKKKNPNSLISPQSFGVIDKNKKSANKMQIFSARKYNYSTLNENYKTLPSAKTKNIISTKKVKQDSLLDSTNSKKQLQKNKFNATQKISLNLGSISNQKNDKKIIKTSKVDLLVNSSRNKKIDLTKTNKKQPVTTKNAGAPKLNFELEKKKKILEAAELELARREKQKLDEKKEELKRELEIQRLSQTLHQKKNMVVNKRMIETQKKGIVSPQIQPEFNPLSLDNSQMVQSKEASFILNLAKVEETKSQKFKAEISEDVNQMLTIISKANEDQNVEEAYEIIDQFEQLAFKMKQKLKKQIKKKQ